jgi:hypothetical protein
MWLFAQNVEALEALESMEPLLTGHGYPNTHPPVVRNVHALYKCRSLTFAYLRLSIHAEQK